MDVLYIVNGKRSKVVKEDAECPKGETLRQLESCKNHMPCNRKIFKLRRREVSWTPKHPEI